MTSPADIPEHRTDLGLGLVIAYKAIKAVLELVGGILLAVAVHRHHLRGIDSVSQHLAAHLTSSPMVGLAHLVLEASAPRFLKIGAALLVVDAFVSGFEGFALLRGWWWGPWLVVVATGSFLPIELYGIYRRPHWGTEVTFLLNLAVVIYLVWRKAREHRKPLAPSAG